MKLVQTHLAATFPMFEEGESLFFLDVALVMGLAPLVMFAVMFAGGFASGVDGRGERTVKTILNIIQSFRLNIHMRFR